MNKKIILLISFGVVAFVQLAVPAWMIVRREITLQKGLVFKFHTQPVDPVDAFRGRYVWLRLDPDSIKVQDANRWVARQEAYAVLAATTNGFALVQRLERDAPTDAHAVAVRVLWSDTRTGEVHFQWPFDRFYMEEGKAPTAEHAYREHSRRGQHNAYVTVRIHGRQAVLENLFIEDRPIREFLKK